MLIDKAFRRRITGRLDPSESRILDGMGASNWVHASSVGEVSSVIPLVSALKAGRPETPIVLTTFTRTGCRHALGRAEGADVVTLAPYDLPGAIGRFTRAIRPQALLLVESELWPNTIRGCDSRGCRVAVISGRITARSFGKYVLVRGLFRTVLRRVRCVGAQTQADADRFVELGMPRERTFVTGSLKLSVPPEAPPGDVTRQRLGIPAGRRIVAAGSTRKGEEETVLRAFRAAKKPDDGLLLVLAPRHLSRLREVRNLLDRQAATWRARSDVGEGKGIAPTEDVLLLDRMGELASIYSISEMAFVGGSLVKVGGHNPLEPAAFGVPVLFGPYMEHHGWDLLVRAGAAVSVAGEAELANAMADWFDHPAEAASRGQAGMRVVSESSGALERTMAMLEGEGVV